MTGTMRVSPGCLTATTRPRRNTTPCSYCLTMRNESSKPINTEAPRTIITTNTAMVRSFLNVEIGARVTALRVRRRRFGASEMTRREPSEWQYGLRRVGTSPATTGGDDLGEAD